MDFYKILKASHSGLRWVALILLVVAIVNALMKWQTKGKFTKSDRLMSLFAMVVIHIQVVIGLIMYFLSPKVNLSAPFDGDMTRFYTVEHISLMIVSAVLITIGYSRAKRIKAGASKKKFRTIFLFYLIGLILILLAIPWPPRFGAGWY